LIISTITRIISHGRVIKSVPPALYLLKKTRVFTYKELVNELRKGKDVRITGSVGKRLAYSMGADLVHFGGSGTPEKAGKIYIDGNVSSESQ